MNELDNNICGHRIAKTGDCEDRLSLSRKINIRQQFISTHLNVLIVLLGCGIKEKPVCKWILHGCMHTNKLFNKYAAVEHLNSKMRWTCVQKTEQNPNGFRLLFNWCGKK